MPNPKPKTLNSKQYQNPNSQSSKRFGYSNLKFWNLFRIWNLGFKTSREAGFASLVSILLIFVIATFVTSLLALSALTDERISRDTLHSTRSFATAESGLEDALLRIMAAKQYPASGSLSLNGGTATVLADTSGASRSVTSTANVTSRFRRLASSLTINTQDVEFHYGVQVGEGGLIMENNSKVIGNVYSNGSISGLAKAQITGDAWVAGGTQATPNMQWTATTSDFTFGKRVGSSDQLDAAQSFQTSTTGPVNKVSLYLKKVGFPPSVTVRINQNSGSEPGKNNGDVITSGTLSANLVTANYGWVDVTFSTAPTLTASTTYWIVIDTSRDDANYWVWGYDDTNAYAYGQGKWSPDWNAGNPTWTTIGGDADFKVWMGGVETSIYNINIGGEAHAHRIENSSVSSNAFSVIFLNSQADGNVATDLLQDCSGAILGNASYNTITNCTVNGVTTTPTTPPADPPPQNMPISQGQITQWKADAAIGGTINGDFSPGSSTSLGPKVINGNLILTSNNVVLTLTGTIYVKGYINISNGSTIQLDPSYGPLSGLLLADAWVEVQNNGIFSGSGQAGSYVMLLSLSLCKGVAGPSCTNQDAAIELHNNANGAIFYAPDGLIYLHNGVAATELTGYSMRLNQTATITYQQGLANAQFSSGPGASWKIQSWREVE